MYMNTRKPILLLLVTLMIATVGAQAQTTGGLDLSYQFAPGPSGGVPPGAYAIGPDGKVVAVGGFTTYHRVARKNVARLNSDGTVDTSLDAKGGAGEVVLVIPGIFTNKSPGQVTQVMVQADGKVVVGGSFTSWDGFETKNVARLKTDGSVDSTFKSTALVAGPMLELPDGKFLICGKSSDFGAGRKTGVVRVNASGSLDGTFTDSTLGAAAGTFDGQVTVSQMRRQSDGRSVVIFGGLKTISPLAFVGGVARLNENGSLDTTFKIGTTTGANSSPMSLSVDTSGRVLVAGTSPTYDGQNVGKVFRLQGDGNLDTTYSFTLTTTLASGILAIGDGSALVTGSFTGVVGPVVRLNPDGSRDSSYGFTQTGTFGSLILAICSDPKTASSGETYLSGSMVLAEGTKVTQALGIFRLTGNSSGGGGATAPIITTHPAPASAVTGGSAAFTAAASGTAPLNYQWKLDGKEIPGATSATLTVSNVSDSNAGDYTVTVSNFGGSVTSNPATHHDFATRHPECWTRHGRLIDRGCRGDRSAQIPVVQKWSSPGRRDSSDVDLGQCPTS